MPLFLTSLLNLTTMYRSMLYVLIFYLAASIFESIFGILPYSASNIFLTSAILVTASLIVNKIFKDLLDAYANPESTIITALILALIVGPISPLKNIMFLALVSFLAVASKYVLAINKRHVFNPTAIGVLLSALLIRQSASWWIGNAQMLAFVALGGILMLAKVKRFTLAFTFLLSYLIPSMFFGVNPLTVLVYSPIVFFTTVMLIEPLTSPVETRKQVIYAAFVGFALVFFQQTLRVTYTLELALVVGNVLSYFISKPFRLNLEFIKKEKIAKNTYTFYFKPDKEFDFAPGQFLHWTLPHKHPDARGVRRFFTICSSPTYEHVEISVKVPEENPSSFKRSLMNLQKGDKAVVIDPSGEFTLPEDKSKPLAFIAGGIGVTPFISMVRWMIDKGQKRDITLLYSNSIEKEVCFKNLLRKAEKYGLKTIYVVTKKDGYIDEDMIREKIPDWKERIFYVSGPQPMVELFKKMLSKMGVQKVKTDFFPGYKETHQK